MMVQSNISHLIKIVFIVGGVSLITKLFTLGTFGMIIVISIAIVLYGVC